MLPPVNVYVSLGKIDPWKSLNEQADGHRGFYPLTIKAIYVIGTIYSIGQSVKHLLTHPNAKEVTLIPACGLAMSGIELLGRCLEGKKDTSKSTRDLSRGLAHTLEGAQIKTTIGTYEAYQLEQLRHFALHGQGTAKVVPVPDVDLLPQLRPKLAAGLGRYWHSLLHERENCEKLAGAKVEPIGNWHLRTSLKLFSQKPHRSVEEIFNKLDWSISQP